MVSGLYHHHVCCVPSASDLCFEVPEDNGNMYDDRLYNKPSVLFTAVDGEHIFADETAGNHIWDAFCRIYEKGKDELVYRVFACDRGKHDPAASLEFQYTDDLCGNRVISCIDMAGYICGKDICCAEYL